MKPLARPGSPRLLFALGAIVALPCAAQVDPWEFEVYPYSTTQRGVAEFESDNALVTSGHQEGGQGTARGTIRSQGLLYNSYEFSYGLTDRIEGAVYVNMARPEGSGLRWAGDNIRLRGRLFEQGTLPVDIGWYAEFELSLIHI